MRDLEKATERTLAPRKGGRPSKKPEEERQRAFRFEVECAFENGERPVCPRGFPGFLSRGFGPGTCEVHEILRVRWVVKVRCFFLRIMHRL